MRVREATPEDSAAVQRVHAASIRGLGPEAYSQRQVDAWAAGCETADYPATIESEDTAYVVAERDAEESEDRGEAENEDEDIVAFGCLTLAPTGEEYEADADAEITAVYVHPDVARDGVGTRVYEHLEQRARDHGFESLALWASRNAVAFYEAKGYERVTDHDHEFSGHESTGVTGTVVEMRKRLEGVP